MAMQETPYRLLALQKALTQVGTKEDPPGSNYGPQVAKYEAVTGAFRAAWCASFVQWAFEEVGFPQPVFSKSAYVPYIVDTARSLGWTVTPQSMQVGDLACYDWQHDGVADHIGIVQVKSVSAFRAVEGNTAMGNESNGGEVMLRDRSFSDVQAFIRVPGSKDVKVPNPTPRPVPSTGGLGPQYYTLKKSVPLHNGQTLAFTAGKGYWADPTFYTFKKDVKLKNGQVLKFEPGAGYYAE